MNNFYIVKNKELKVINDKPEIHNNGILEKYYCGLGFDGDCNLTIYNNRKIENAASLSQFIGEKVVSIDRGESTVIFNFTNNKKIIVSLEDKDWSGPEAMQLNYKGKIYIWDHGNQFKDESISNLSNNYKNYISIFFKKYLFTLIPASLIIVLYLIFLFFVPKEGDLISASADSILGAFLGALVIIGYMIDLNRV